MMVLYNAEFVSTWAKDREVVKQKQIVIILITEILMSSFLINYRVAGFCKML
jgi:hypothetical protein